MWIWLEWNRSYTVYIYTSNKLVYFKGLTYVINNLSSYTVLCIIRSTRDIAQSAQHDTKFDVAVSNSTKMHGSRQLSPFTVHAQNLPLKAAK